MNIYILRDGRQIGPFSAEAAQVLIEQGDVTVDDLAWRKGTPDWLPLGEILRAADAAAQPPMEAEAPTTSTADAATNPEAPETPPAEPPPEISTEPATAAQIAFLSYFNVPIPAGLLKDEAEVLIGKATDDPANAKRLVAWESDRMRLHPDLFSAEVQAKKEDRVQLFYDLCQTAGADHFKGVTKAHCQVLVAFLDLKFPRWDADQADATERYFFPAIAEKFPQLVEKAWRGRLHYGAGESAMARATRKTPTAKLVKKQASAIGAIFRGLVLGLVILGVLYAVHYYQQQKMKKPQPQATTEPAATP